MRKRILSVVLAGALSASVIAGSAISASAVKNPDDTYTPGQGITARTYKFAMPGSWMTDYWKANENAAGIYWWTGAETPETVFTHAWPGYKVNRVNEEGVENLYSTPAPADANQIIFNAHIDGGMPNTEGFIQEKFDAARQIKDTPAQYYAFLESDYQTKDLWTYVWDKAADAVDADHIEWDMTDPKMTDAEAEAIAELYETLQEEEVELDIPEFGDYSKNFFVEMENGDGIGMNFDNMVFVVNMDPNTMSISTTIVKEGMITYGGDWMFYYGNGEYGNWPTKELLLEKTGITFDEAGKPVLPEGSELMIDDYGTVNRIYKTGDGKEQKLMVYGNFTGKYYSDTTAPEIPDDMKPTTAPTTTPIPTASPDATSATQAKSNSTGTTTTNSANGAVATGDFALAVIIFVVIAAGAGVFYFSRKKMRSIIIFFI